MIHGVKTKELVRHPDERGFFEEIIRKTDDFFTEGFAQISHSYMHQGVVKAWHIHKTQIDWWYVVRGTIKAVLFDARKDASTYKETNEFLLNVQGKPNIVLKIPFGVAHGLKVIQGPADLVYVTSGIYTKEEEGRISYTDSDIGYDWVDTIPITNKNIT